MVHRVTVMRSETSWVHNYEFMHALFAALTHDLMVAETHRPQCWLQEVTCLEMKAPGRLK